MNDIFNITDKPTDDTGAKNFARHDFLALNLLKPLPESKGEALPEKPCTGVSHTAKDKDNVDEEEHATLRFIPTETENESGDVVKFTGEMERQLQILKKAAIRQRHLREFLESKLLSFAKMEPTPEQIRLAARFASSVIRDILKKAGVRETDEDAVSRMLALLMKIHSGYTFEHSERVMEWTVALGEEIGMSNSEELQNFSKAAFFRDIGSIGAAIVKAGPGARLVLCRFLKENREALEECGSLHDIGKMQIPQEIINKTAPLTDEEFDIIKTHPIIGAEIVKPYRGLARAIPGIRHHHEKIDGTGYPDKLRGKSIPLAARIIAITDAFDAITEDRPYRRALTREDAVNELLRLSGSQFDPDLVIPFIRALVKRGDTDVKKLQLGFDIFAGTYKNKLTDDGGIFSDGE